MMLSISDVEIGICSICGGTFSNKFAMKRHYENVHAGTHLRTHPIMHALDTLTLF